MKYMVISDIHGSIDVLNKVLNIYNKEKCNKLLILGDLFNYLYDINRNDIVNRLNSLRENIIAVRGNCDNNINDILFDMPYINNTKINDLKITLTHGHLYDKNYLLKTDSNLILTGHSHVADIEKINDKIFVNPGSISKSRLGENSFAIIDNKNITIRNLNNEILLEESI